MLKSEPFKNPPKRFREAPFWSWNDRLAIPELQRQIGEMDRAGWGGFFMHSRVGLETPYMGAEWMACIKASVAEAKRRGMEAWLYDEDNWPSGYAGGVVPRQSPAFRLKLLKFREEAIADPPETVKILARYAAVRRGDGYTHLKPIRVEQEAPARRNGRVILYFYLWTAPLEIPWYNDTSYVDTLNPEATEAFIASTHAKYKRAVGADFGGAIPGIFTDEPSCQDMKAMWLPAVPWSDRFAAYFKKSHGYAIGPHLPSLFFETGDWRKIRYDYRRALQRRFVESYTVPIARWCERNDLKLTGHYLIEDDFYGQLTHAAGGVMPHYEHMAAPGIDHLGKTLIHATLAKQVTSVANQFGKERVLSELYGCSGQDSSFEDRKYMADWHLVHGVNLFCPHLSLYSMRGERKRDYPPNIYYQQPYWPHNRVLADYIGRVAYALTRGRRVIDILLLNSIESAWMAFREPGLPPEVKELDTAFKRVQDHLLADQRDYDLGDEEILARHGSAADGQLTVAQSRYPLAILPPMTVLRETTMQLLERFVATGGALIAVRPTPTYVEGVKDPKRIAKLLRSAQVIAPAKTPLWKAIDREIPREVRVRSKTGRRIEEVRIHQRTQGKSDVYFFSNESRTRAHDVTIRLRGEGKVTLWDTASGRKRLLPAELDAGRTVISTRLEKAGSLLLTRELGLRPLKSRPATNGVMTKKVRLSGSWAIKRRDPNALTLDTCRRWVATDRWSEPEPVWKVSRKLKGGYGTFRVQYPFEAQAVPSGRCSLVMESPEKFVILVNGHRVDPLPSDRYYRDISFRLIEIRKHLRKGTNCIELAAPAAAAADLESGYIVGDFGVTHRANRTFALTTEKTNVRATDLVKEGYPFYAGSFDLSRSFTLISKPKRAEIRFASMPFTHAEIRINGRKAGAVYWHPLSLDVTRLLKKGRNEISIRLTNTLRNLLGPHHLKHSDRNWTGPAEFVNESDWTDTYTFCPFGLGGVELHHS